MKKATIVKVVGGLGAVGLAVGITGGVVGAAQAAGQSADSTAAAADQSCERDGRGAGHRGGTALTGDALAEATAAAQGAVPGGTVLRAAQDADGAIHVHVTRSDGTHVVVRMDEAYQVTSVDELAERAGRGHRGGTALTGDALAEATAAAQEAVPGGTVLRAAQDADGAIHVHVTTSDGTHVVVRMDEAYQVTSVDELADRGGRGHRGGGAPAGAGADPSSADA